MHHYYFQYSMKCKNLCTSGSIPPKSQLNKKIKRLLFQPIQMKKKSSIPLPTNKPSQTKKFKPCTSNPKHLIALLSRNRYVHKRHGQITCSVIQAMASMTRATTSERRMARKARLTDKASVALPDEATEALLLIPAVSISRYFCQKGKKY